MSSSSSFPIDLGPKDLGPNDFGPNIFPSSSSFYFSSPSSTDIVMKKMSNNQNKLIMNSFGIIVPVLLVIITVSLKKKGISYTIPLVLGLLFSIVAVGLSANEVSKINNEAKQKMREEHQLSIAVLSINTLAFLVFIWMGIFMLKQKKIVSPLSTPLIKVGI